MKTFKLTYWLIPFLLFLAQVYFTFSSTSQIRYEELAESVRNVYWLSQQHIYDGVSSNVGWYGTLLIVYKLIGFSLYTAKFFRLLLALLSIFSLAAILKKYLGLFLAVIPLIAISLSPALLFFNTLQTSFGLDLQYFPICLYLLLSLDFSRKWLSLLKLFLLGSISMIAWMSYPTFIYYLPILGLFLGQKILSLPKEKTFWLKISLPIFAFFLPLAVAFYYVSNRGLLLFDPKLQSGIFRGAGIPYFNLSNFWFNFSHLFEDLWNQGSSYYFEVMLPDFSHFLPLLTLAIVLLFSIFVFISQKKYRWLIFLAWLVILINLVVYGFTFDTSGYPGIRRATPALFAFYALYTFTWHYLQNSKNTFSANKTLIIITLLFLPLHHLLAFPINLANLKTPSRYQYLPLFGMTESPTQSLNLFLAQAQKNDLKLSCRDSQGNLLFCRYVEGYAAIAGSCLWNNLSCHSIEGYDGKTKQFIPLKIDLWETYYWEH